MNKQPSLWSGLVLGLTSALALVALFFLGDRIAELPLVPFDIFDWLARVLPGDVITLAIDSIVRTIDTLNLGDTSSAAKVIEQIMAAGMIVVFGAFSGLLVALAARRAPRQGTIVGLVLGAAGLAVSLVAAASFGFRTEPLLSIAWLALLWLGWGALLGSWLGNMENTDAEPNTERRTVLKLAGSSLVAAFLFGGAYRLMGNESRGGPATAANPTPASTPTVEPSPAPPTATLPPGEPTYTPAPATPTPEASPTPTGPTVWEEAASPEALAARPEPVPGTRAELTDNDDFYRIDINTRPVRVDVADWELVVDGLFESTDPLTLADLMAYPAVIQPLTMSCISNRVGGDLIGTTNWTGLRLRDLLDDLGLQPVAQVLRLEGADGFYEYVEMADMMDERTLLVYEMNGEPLPVEHGFPLRIYIPNRYGMKQPKWITRMEAAAEWEPGYWVTRGWSRDARPQIVSVIDSVNVEEQVEGRIPVGGIAWAGDRGIQKVEVQVDDGEWNEAELLSPPLSPLTWMLWRYEWAEPTPGRHTLRVRATDGTGELQIESVQGVRPDGATGYHEEDVRI